MGALLYLDHVFTETLKAREEATRSKTADAKQQKEDAIQVAELDGLHRHTVDYHMRVVEPFPEYKFAFMKGDWTCTCFVCKRRSSVEKERT